MTVQEGTAGDAGESHTVTVQIGDTAGPLKISLPPGDIPPEGILPALRAITDEVVARAIVAAQAKGHSISCAAGCAACCRHLPMVSDIEARALADLVGQMPEPRRSSVRARFAAAGQRVTLAGLAEPINNAIGLSADRIRTMATDYFRLRIDCPFLEEERCSIYADRPLVCRRMIATSPAAFCADPDDNRVRTLRIPKLAAAALLLTSDEEPPQPAVVPLPFILDWAASNPASSPQRGADQWMQRFVNRLADTET